MYRPISADSPICHRPLPAPLAPPPQLNQTLLERDQELASLQHKLQLAEDELEKAEAKVKELKTASDEGETHRTTGENLARKVQLLEEELDKAEKDLKDTTEK
jgi:tropomyosin